MQAVRRTISLSVPDSRPDAPKTAEATVYEDVFAIHWQPLSDYIVTHIPSGSRFGLPVETKVEAIARIERLLALTEIDWHNLPYKTKPGSLQCTLPKELRERIKAAL